MHGHGIDGAALRPTIRRIFSGLWGEIFGELFQNAQRAEANELHISTTPFGLVIEDDGHGIPDAAGWLTLLTLGGSSYQSGHVEHQHPMGVGVHSILAHGDVEEVAFESCGRKVVIDNTTAWWSDPSYYTPIFERIAQDQMDASDVTNGFRVTMVLRRGLSEVDVNYAIGDAYHTVESSSLVAGYADYFTVYLNDKRLAATEHEVTQRYNPLFTFVYEGAEVIVSGGSVSHGVINWYGQRVRFTSPTLSAYVRVRNSRPFDLRAPSRLGVIDNERWQHFLHTLRVQTFQYVSSHLNELPEELVLRYLKTRDGLQLPVFSATLLYEGWNSDEEFDDRHCPQVFSYDDPPFLLDKTLRVWSDEEQGYVAAEYGAASFLKMLKERFGFVYHLVDGRVQDVPLYSVYWRPGDCIEEKVLQGGIKTTRSYHEGGEYALVRAGEDEEPTEWFPVTTPVIAVFDTASWDMREAGFIAGGSPLSVLTGPIKYAQHEDDDDPRGATEAWEKSVEIEACSFMGDDTIPFPDNPYRLQGFLPSGTDIKTVEYHHGRHDVVERITITNVSGESRTFRIYH